MILAQGTQRSRLLLCASPHRRLSSLCIRESRFEATSRVVLSTWGPRVWRCTLIIWTPGWSEYGVTDGRRKVHALDAHRIQGFYGVSNESRDKEDLYVSANYRYVRRGLRASGRRRDRRRERSARSKRQWCGHDHDHAWRHGGRR